MGWFGRNRGNGSDGGGGESDEGAPKGALRRFITTRWSIVLKAGQGDARGALSALCQWYWYPIYSFIRGEGIGQEDARDITQGFFASLLSGEDLQKVDPDRGRFRTWLRRCAKNYMLNRLKHDHALKRHPKELLSLDFMAAEERMRFEPTDPLPPERLFDRRWAQMVIERALAGLRSRYAHAGQDALFAQLEATLLGDDDQPSDITLSELLSKKPATVRVARHRLREKYGESLREEVAKTVARPELVDDEIRMLIDALA